MSRRPAPPLVIKIYTGPPRPAYCFACGAREDLTAPDVRVFQEGTWAPLCDTCRETEILGRMLRHGLRWEAIAGIQAMGISAEEWAARGGSPDLWAVAAALKAAEVPA